jgi:hypothetical protein
VSIKDIIKLLLKRKSLLNIKKLEKMTPEEAEKYILEDILGQLQGTKKGLLSDAFDKLSKVEDKLDAKSKEEVERMKKELLKKLIGEKE